MTEFPLWLSLERAARAPATATKTADPAEAEAMAARLGLDAIRELVLSATLERTASGDVYRARGEVLMRALRTCVSTLEDFEEETRTTFEEYFTTTPDKATDQSDDAPLSPEEDDVTLVEGDGVDIGEIAAQHLAMAINPYPRAPGAPEPEADAPSPETRRPFAGLDALLAKRNDGG